MSMTTDGVWKAGTWASTVWGEGVWREGDAPGPAVDVQGCGCMEVLTATGVLEATVVLSEMTVLLATAEMEVIVCEGC